MTEASGDEIRNDLELYLKYARIWFLSCLSQIKQIKQQSEPPLINGEDIVLILSVFNASDGWNYSLSEEMVSQLNYIDFENNFDTFALLPTSRNTRAAYSSNTALQPLTRMPGYYPRYKIDESTYKECKLVSPQGQGNYGRCWAAVCATMLNYEFGVPMTAERICDLKGIDYNEGADSKTMCETLVESGLYRRVYYEQLAWGDIITEINNKRLIGLGAYTDDREYGHAVTVVGYRRILNYCYVILWNSALNGNCGERQVVIFDEDGTTFTTGNKVFRWSESIAR